MQITKELICALVLAFANPVVFFNRDALTDAPPMLYFYLNVNKATMHPLLSLCSLFVIAKHLLFQGIMLTALSIGVTPNQYLNNQKVSLNFFLPNVPAAHLPPFTKVVYTN